ncbi:MAG: ATP-dependent zinc metalloprotease FtsH [Hyphomicrobiaceae bacterium]
MPNDRSSPQQNGPGKSNNWSPIAIWLAVVAALLLISIAGLPTEPGAQNVAYSEIKTLIRNGDIAEVVLEKQTITAKKGETHYRAVTPIQGDPGLLSLLEKHDVRISARKQRPESILTYILPWVLILALFMVLRRGTLGSMGGLGSRGLGDLFSGRFSRPTEQRSRVTFDDVAGQDQAKKEVAELVEFLREPDRFSRVGAEVPHGVLLMGPPGTGKTLLAKALAGEANVPFFSTSGSEFIEVFVGVGAGRVRQMFRAARKAAPAVIFIDELDSIGRTRGTGLGGGHDEREQTLNQILAELDGFEEKEAVVVLAATNRPDVLDPALLRPGRFDRHVLLNLPDKNARRDILGIHARNLPLADAGDLDLIAAGTPGFSGADLKNLLNEAAISAARRNGERIRKGDLQEARDKVMMGTVRTLAIQPEEHHRLAVHEAGHTVVAFFTPDADPLYKVTIIPRGRSLGGTHMLSENERHTLPESYLRAQLITLLAGRVAEKLLLGTVSSGADDDISRATQIARSMVAKWGMSEEIGAIDLRQHEEHPFLGQAIAQPRDYADETAAKVDRAVMALLGQAEDAAKKIIAEHKDETLALIRKLEAEEVLDLEQIRACLQAEKSTRMLEPGR